MSVVLCTLVLNEMEWLPRLWEQHKNWPGMLAWIFVEAADKVYAETNPNMVDPVSKCLSVDGTTEFLIQLHRDNTKVHYIPHGLCSSTDKANGKCIARSRYLEMADNYNPDYLVIVDADEFHSYKDQARIEQVVSEMPLDKQSFIFTQRHIWYPPTIRTKEPTPYKWQPLFSQEVVGGYWSVPHCRVYRWQPGLKYERNHNHPQDTQGRMLNASTVRFNRGSRNVQPECIHMGFASSLQSREAKHKYYVARGEGKTDRRQWYVDCRLAWQNYRLGDRLPHGANIVTYYGQIPECFL
jgi:hypothetical protein